MLDLKSTSRIENVLATWIPDTRERIIYTSFFSCPSYRSARLPIDRRYYTLFLIRIIRSRCLARRRHRNTLATFFLKLCTKSAVSALGRFVSHTVIERLHSILWKGTHFDFMIPFLSAFFRFIEGDVVFASVHFCPFLSISVHFCPFLSMYLHISFFHTKLHVRRSLTAPSPYFQSLHCLNTYYQTPGEVNNAALMLFLTAPPPPPPFTWAWGGVRHDMYKGVFRGAPRVTSDKKKKKKRTRFNSWEKGFTSWERETRKLRPEIFASLAGTIPVFLDTGVDVFVVDVVFFFFPFSFSLGILLDGFPPHPSGKVDGWWLGGNLCLFSFCPTYVSAHVYVSDRTCVCKRSSCMRDLQRQIANEEENSCMGARLGRPRKFQKIY